MSGTGGTAAGGTGSGGTTTGWSGTGTATTGATGTGAYTGTGGPLQAAGSYPPCSRTVTDSCIQTNERGRRRR